MHMANKWRNFVFEKISCARSVYHFNEVIASHLAICFLLRKAVNAFFISVFFGEDYTKK